MAVSGTISTTSIDVVSIIEKAFRRVRITPVQITAEMATEARKTLFLRLSALANKGLQLWAIESVSESLVLDQAAYTLDDGTIDVVQINFTNSDGIETPLAPVGKDSYMSLSDKTASGQPSMYWLDRQRDAPVVRLWPVPDAVAETGTLTVWRKRHIMDVGDYTNTLDIPQRWHDAVIWDLASALGIETQEVDLQVATIAQGKANEEILLALRSETDGAPMVFRPNIGSYTR